jgi:hypothetical protein
MSNLTSDRDTEFVDQIHRDEIPMAAGVKICSGAAVAVNAATGFANSAGPGAGVLRGIADETVDNTADSAGGAQTIDLITPEAAYFDGTGFTQANVGDPVYFSDDHTVTLTAGTNTLAGRVLSVDTEGILVDLRAGYVAATGSIAPQAAPAAPAAITASLTIATGETGAAAGGFDTAAHRDALITTVGQLVADVTALRAEIVARDAILAAAGIT